MTAESCGDLTACSLRVPQEHPESADGLKIKTRERTTHYGRRKRIEHASTSYDGQGAKAGRYRSSEAWIPDAVVGRPRNQIAHFTQRVSGRAKHRIAAGVSRSVARISRKREGIAIERAEDALLR